MRETLGERFETFLWGMGVDLLIGVRPQLRGTMQPACLMSSLTQLQGQMGKGVQASL